MIPAAHIPKDASDAQVIAIIRAWLDVLAQQDYERVFAALGYGMAFGDPGAASIRGALARYRSLTYYPGVEDFVVTDWRSAEGGNPTPLQALARYRPGATGLVGAAEFDLPLNGKWSDLTACFVWFRGNTEEDACRLSLEDICSTRQLQREADALDS